MSPFSSIPGRTSKCLTRLRRPSSSHHGPMPKHSAASSTAETPRWRKRRATAFFIEYNSFFSAWPASRPRGLTTGHARSLSLSPSLSLSLRRRRHRRRRGARPPVMYRCKKISLSRRGREREGGVGVGARRAVAAVAANDDSAAAATSDAVIAAKKSFK